ncbi:uncharacterized protein BX663DRAFT_517497 [Cokeromyces recurvatus]|uniref:uncharacterized protein n=1 Tax=Cokeromyces recurvatus TaxID=90255 RepID=UPI0022201737|nr:uncharacterized protein BX663DRAFT_517497 [Cokeromyces recurvatus]KAI7900419.1 hypothetical protein BX663DRAFT_517497 [Cokeromyces recurvatus]
MAKRKVSCLQCRTKKVKCDGGKPCSRCEKRQINCVYQEHRAVGRPPKNAVVNKLALSQVATGVDNKLTAITTNLNTRSTTTFCREFIFENASVTSLIPPLKHSNSATQFNLTQYINNIFSTYFINSTLKKSLLGENDDYQLITCNESSSKFSMRIKIFDLTQSFIWFSADIAAILLKRISKLHFPFCSNLKFTTILYKYDPTTSFFEPSLYNCYLHSINNPLNSLPPQQAINLIECFFSIDPYSIIVNKTILLQSYWTDTADPLLLSVIYGTSLYKSQILDGKPLEFWNGLYKKDRNPFLEYAYYLLSKNSAEAALSSYQAIVLLALFEVNFGFPKRGTTLIAISYSIASKLGLSFDSNTTTLSTNLNPVEKELLLVTFWSAFEHTIRGSVEFDKVPRVVTFHHQPYPPPNIDSSKSYQYDRENNNPRTCKMYAYIVEAFYVKTIISKITSKLILQIPHILNTTTVTKSSFSKLDKEESFIVIEDDQGQDITINMIEKKMRKVLDEFQELIENNRKNISSLQACTLELYHLYFGICLLFLRDTLLNPERKRKQDPFNLHEHHLPSTLDLTDTNHILAITSAMPKAIDAIEKCLLFLSDSTNYQNQPRFLPYGIILYTLDAASQVLMHAYQLEKSEKIQYYLKMAEIILDMPSIWDNWKTITIPLQTTIHSFLKENYPAFTFENISSSYTFDEKYFNIPPPMMINDITSQYVDPKITTTYLMTSLLQQQQKEEEEKEKGATELLQSSIESCSYYNSWITNNSEYWIQDINNIPIVTTSLELQQQQQQQQLSLFDYTNSAAVNLNDKL